MKTKLLFTLFFFGLTLASFSQIVSIPDANFKAKLLQANTGIQIAKNLAGQWFKIDANSDSQIQTAEAQQVSALYTNFSSIASMTGIASFTNLKVLSCFNNSITSLDVSALSQLQELYCYDNNLATLVVTGTALKRLDCFNNPFIVLNLTSLITLEYLNCTNTNIANLNVSNLIHLETLLMPNLTNTTLVSLNASGCTSLVTIPEYISGSALTNINFSNCTSLTGIQASNIVNLSVFNVSGCTALQSLKVNNTGLSNLNVSGLTNLMELKCWGNYLTTLNVSGLTSLADLGCEDNQLGTLNLSGLTNLTAVDCSNNQLLSLNLTGLSNLYQLNCSSNQLLSLDLSQCVSINFVSCGSNQLLSLFMKNGKNETIYFDGNPILLYICTDDYETGSVQFQVDQLGYTNCQVNTYCSFEPGGVFYTIQGNTKLDANVNGCDTGDLNYTNLKFDITNGTNTGSVVANTSGSYSLPVIVGTHTVTPVLENPTYFSISPTNFQVSFPATASPFTQDFCVTANGVHPDVEITLVPIDTPRPGFNVKYRMVYKNKGNQIANGQVGLSFQDDVMDLVSSVPTTTSQALNSLVWDYTNLQPFESRTIDFMVNLNTPMETPPLNGNDIISFTASITPVAGDATSADNQFILPQTVLNSFDPNDKTCLEGDRITPAMIGKYIHYKIRFENTGNFAAQNIVIKDIIDNDKFDVSSLQMTNASHSCVTKISEGNKVEFIFENINLPFDDANNDGYVVFKIKTKPTVVLNDILRNQASIYFDYNFPIITNEAQTVVGNALANQQFSSTIFKVYPNPVKNLLNIQSKELPTKIEIFDTNGRLLQSAPINNNQADVSSLSSGTYFVKIYSKEHSGVVKITKE